MSSYINGTSGDDVINGSSADEHIVAWAGSDTVYGNSGNDTLSGGEGNDALYGGHGTDQLTGGDGNDTLDGGKWSDSLYSGNGNDRLYGGQGDDTFYIEGGDNKIWGGNGADKFEFYVYQDADHDIWVPGGLTPSNAPTQNTIYGFQKYYDEIGFYVDDDQHDYSEAKITGVSGTARDFTLEWSHRGGPTNEIRVTTNDTGLTHDDLGALSWATGVDTAFDLMFA